MALRNILEDGDPILRKTCREVDQVTERTQMILDDMVETMRQAQGVGLAAPQVGIVRRMFVAEPLVDRPEKIVIKGLDREGNPQEFALEGFPAIVMCHEYDHLDGILYKDKAKEMYELTDAADTTEE